MYPKKTLSEAIGLISSHSRVFIQGGAATPNVLIKELVQQAERLEDVTLIHLHTEGPAEYANAKYQKNFRVINLFTGSNLRRHLDYDRIDYLPCFISEVPRLFRSKECPLDVALLHVSVPDRFGYCSLGVSVDVAHAASQCAALLIAQVNPQMPRIHGDGLIHMSAFAAMVEVDEPLPESPGAALTEQEVSIARSIAALIEDGSTLQLGIGSIPNAVTHQLLGHRDLGIHSEMWADGALQLLKKGVVTNSCKKVHQGKSVSSFLMGTKELFDFVNDNPALLQLGIDYVNNPNIIARNPRVVAINSAVEIDLSGQVCADSIGHRIISGFGGQVDFMRGAALSEGGKSIIAINSVTNRGESKIVTTLKPGAGVVTTRADVHYVVTEYGTAQLYGKTLGERARALLKIAHPSHRSTLERDLHASYLG